MVDPISGKRILEITFLEKMDFNKHELAFILGCIDNGYIAFEPMNGRYRLTEKQISGLVRRFKKKLAQVEAYSMGGTGWWEPLIYSGS